MGHEVTVAKSLGQNVVVNEGGGSGAGRRESSPDSSPHCRHFFHPRHAFKLSSIFFQSELFYSPLLFLERFDRTIPASSPRPLFMGSVEGKFCGIWDYLISIRRQIFV